MNSKAIAAMMAIVMMVVGFTVVAADGSDAVDPLEIDKVIVKVSDTEVSDNFAVNEGNYSHYDYTLTWKMKVGDTTEVTLGTVSNKVMTGNNVYYVDDNSISVQSDSPNFTVQLLRDSSDVGIYNLSIIGSKVTSNDISYTLTATIEVTVNGVSAGTMDVVTFNGSVSVYNVEAGGEINVQMTPDEENADSTANVGSYYDRMIQITTPGMTASDYQWYAVGLPDGLTMSTDGYVSGIPIETWNKSFRAYATDDDGNVFYGTVDNLNVDPKIVSDDSPEGFSYTINTDETAKKQYVFKTGDDIVLHVKNADKTELDQSAVDVQVINDSNSGDIIVEPNYDNGFHLPSDGSGAYIVKITYNDVSTTFSVYIIGSFTGIEPGIVIEGA